MGSKIRFAAAGFGGALLTMSLVLAFTGVVRASNTASLIGQPAPAFVLPDVRTGAMTSLAASLKTSKAVVVIFISTQCPISNGYDVRMSDLAEKYAAKGVEFIGINANQTEPAPQVAAHAKLHKFPFPVLKDASDSVANAYGAHVTPEAYVIAPSGAVEYHGRIDDSVDESAVTTHDLAAALNEVLAGKPVSKPTAKAFGCMIRRSA